MPSIYLLKGSKWNPNLNLDRIFKNNKLKVSKYSKYFNLYLQTGQSTGTLILANALCCRSIESIIYLSNMTWLLSILNVPKVTMEQKTNKSLNIITIGYFQIFFLFLLRLVKWFIEMIWKKWGNSSSMLVGEKCVTKDLRSNYSRMRKWVKEILIQKPWLWSDLTGRRL